MDFFNLEMLEFISIGQALLWTAIAILADALAGIFLAIKRREFDLQKVFQFLKTSVLPYIGALAIASVLAYGAPITEVIFLTFAAGVTISYIKQFYDKLIEIGRKQNDDQQDCG